MARGLDLSKIVYAQKLFVYTSNGATDKLAPLTSYSRNGGRKFLGSYRAGRQFLGSY